jgi:hypothetical protein
MSQPKLIAELPVQRRVRVHKAAIAELSARAKAAAVAERRLNDYLAGVVTNRMIPSCRIRAG